MTPMGYKVVPHPIARPGLGADLSQDARFAALRTEYHYYFDPAPLASAAYR